MLIRIGNGGNLRRTYSTQTKMMYIKRCGDADVFTVKQPKAPSASLRELRGKAIVELLRQKEELSNSHAAEALDAGIHIETYGGYCPVESTGTFDGVQFNFRSRYAYWTVEVGDINDLGNEHNWFNGGEYGEEQNSASWMNQADAYHFINRSYRKWKIHLLSLGFENL